MRRTPPTAVRSVPAALALLLATSSALLGQGTKTSSPQTVSELRREEAVTALIMNEKEELRPLELVTFEGGQLYYRPPNVPEGIYASIDPRFILQMEFDLKLEPERVNDLKSARNWAGLAKYYMQRVLPVLRFVAAAPNNAADPLLDTGSCLMRAGAAYRDQASGKGRADSRAAYQRAYDLLDRLSEARWYDRAGEAEVMAIQCLIELGKLEQAGSDLDAVAEPEAGDPGAGLYWLTRANLSYAQGDSPQALEAAVKSSAFESKVIETFADALLLTGRCYEDLGNVHRARDVYYEVARLFQNTHWGDLARKRLESVMASQQASVKEDANVTKVFFDVEEDMDQVARDFLTKTAKTQTPAPPPAGTQEPNTKEPKE